MRRIINLASLVVVLILATGCAGVMPQYSMSVENVQKLKDNGNFTAKVGEFASANSPDNVNPLQIRANTGASPYHDSFAAYVNEALKQELTLANKYSADSTVEISGTLLKNSVDAAISTGSANIQARFIVKNHGQVRYDQIKSAHHEWESSFAGAIAIPKATQEYTFVVQKLLGSLYADQAFLDALK